MTLVKSPFTITKNSDNITFLASDLDTVNEWKQLMKYSVPLGTAIEITPANYHFGFYFNTTTTKITGGETRVKKQNANGTETRELWQGANGIFGDIGDVRKRPSFNIPVVANASQQIVIEVKNLGDTLDVSQSDYQLECMQVYEQI